MVETQSTEERPVSPYMLPRGYLSASQISMFMRCGMQYYYRYILGIYSPPNVAMFTGSSVHAGLEEYHGDIIEFGMPLMTPDETAEFAISHMEEEIEEKNLPFAGAEKDKAVREVQTGIKEYIDVVSPNVVPLSVEEELRFEIVEGLPILGYIDMTYKPVDKDGKILSDYKVTEKKWSLGKLVNNIQFLLYALGTGIQDIEIHNIKKHQVYERQAGRNALHNGDSVVDISKNIRVLRHTFNSAQEAEHTKRVVTAVADGITKGNFMPCDPDSWVCSKDWCSYWGLCRGKR